MPPQSTAVQIAQVTTRVPQTFIPYFFNMPVNTDHQQSANFRSLSSNCQSWNTGKMGISNLLNFYKTGIVLSFGNMGNLFKSSKFYKLDSFFQKADMTGMAVW